MKTDKKLKAYSEVEKLCQKLRKANRKIVFTSGCYDLLHLGHVIHLTQCRLKGDVLIVNVGNDETVRLLKGKERPIMTQKVRARMLAALETVDYVVISEEHGKMDHSELIKLIKPAYYVVNKTDSHMGEKRDLIESIGGSLITVRRVPPKEAIGVSTTNLVQRLQSLL